MKKAGIILLCISVITIIASVIAYFGIIGSYPFDSEDKGIEYYSMIMMIKSIFVIGNLAIIAITTAILTNKYT